MNPREQDVDGATPTPEDGARVDGGGRPWKSAIVDLVAKWQVRRRRERIAIVLLAAFIAVGLSLVGGLNSEITEIQDDAETGAELAPSSRFVVEVGEIRQETPPEATPTTVVQSTPTSKAEPEESTTPTVAPSASLSVDLELPSESAEQPGNTCHPSYEPCIPDVNYSLGCAEILVEVTIIGGADPYGLDTDGDGIACENN